MDELFNLKGTAFFIIIIILKNTQEFHRTESF